MMIVKELTRAAARRPREVVAAVAPALLVNALYVGQAVALAHALAAAARGRLQEALFSLGAVALMTLVRVGVALVQASAASQLGARVRLDVRAAGLRGVLRPEALRDPARRPGALRATLSDGVDGVDAYVSAYYPALLTLAIATPAVLLGLAWVSWPAALVVAVGVALALLAPKAWSRLMARRSQEQWESYEGLAAELSEALRGMQTLRALGRVPWSRRRIHARSERLRQQTERAMRASLAETALTDLAIQGALAAAAACAVVEALAPGSVASQTYLILMLSGEAFRPVRELSKQWHAGYLGLGAVAGLRDIGAFEAGETRQTQGATAAARETPVTSAGAVAGVAPAADPATEAPGEGLRVSAVRFAYEEGRPVLDGVNLRAERGGLTAIVGASGAGKSTLFDVVLGFVEPGHGSVRLDGAPLRARDVALVSQHPVLFEGTVRDNLDPAGTGHADAALEEACRAAGVWEDVLARGGLEASVAESGRDLSGGQLQRLAVARALLTGRPVLLLDEPTSALDEATAASVLSTLRRVAEHRVVLVSTHRPGELPLDTRVLALSEGRLAPAPAPSEENA
ncbi:ATP-binding cassette domain-containing protein [Galactobacter valiniphilus]|uniref:ATP-binding cassette domain-containing protein n=1 Tax=Galactobacter valiniphilus TaxID=2676122 RepID=A0A399J6F7_9MICC|nr:ATP-binding cassette domain-containing protein [Galactobacter valiniphilus]RII41045.1 ATP-binding cassette domain-containing protein [Galactobacter valiniphilus]